MKSQSSIHELFLTFSSSNYTNCDYCLELDTNLEVITNNLFLVQETAFEMFNFNFSYNKNHHCENILFQDSIQHKRSPDHKLVQKLQSRKHLIVKVLIFSIS